MPRLSPVDPKSLELIEAAFVCDFVRVRALLAEGAHPDARDEDGRTPLFSAVLGGSVGVAALLIEAGADLNARDTSGWTALHFCAQEYELELARILVARGADVNLQDRGRRHTPVARGAGRRRPQRAHQLAAHERRPRRPAEHPGRDAAGAGGAPREPDLQRELTAPARPSALLGHDRAAPAQGQDRLEQHEGQQQPGQGVPQLDLVLGRLASAAAICTRSGRLSRATGARGSTRAGRRSTTKPSAGRAPEHAVGPGGADPVDARLVGVARRRSLRPAPGARCSRPRPSRRAW